MLQLLEQIPLKLVVKTVVRQAVLLQPIEVRSGAETHLQTLEDPTLTQMDAQKLSPCEQSVREQAPGRTCRPMERGPHTETALLARFLHGVPCRSNLLLKNCTLWKRHMLEQFGKNCSSREGPMSEKLIEDCVPWEGLHAGIVD